MGKMQLVLKRDVLLENHGVNEEDEELSAPDTSDNREDVDDDADDDGDEDDDIPDSALNEFELDQSYLYLSMINILIGVQNLYILLDSNNKMDSYPQFEKLRLRLEDKLLDKGLTKVDTLIFVHNIEKLIGLFSSSKSNGSRQKEGAIEESRKEVEGPLMLFPL